MATRLVASEIDLTAGPTRASMLSMDPQERELDALIGLYLLRCEAEGKSPETQRAYRESLQRFCRFVHLVNGPRDVHELTPRLIYHFLASFAHLSLETRHRYFREVRCFFNWLIETDRLTTSPFRGIRNVRLPQRIVAPFTRAEIGVLLAACPPTPVGRRDRAIILVLLDTGIRCSELAQTTSGRLRRHNAAHSRAARQGQQAASGGLRRALRGGRGTLLRGAGPPTRAPLRRSERRQRPVDGISDRTQTERHQADAAPTGPAGRRPQGPCASLSAHLRNLGDRTRRPRARRAVPARSCLA